MVFDHSMLAQEIPRFYFRCLMEDPVTGNPCRDNGHWKVKDNVIDYELKASKDARIFGRRKSTRIRIICGLADQGDALEKSGRAHHFNPAACHKLDEKRAMR